MIMISGLREHKRNESLFAHWSDCVDRNNNDNNVFNYIYENQNTFIIRTNALDKATPEGIALQ